MSQEKRKSIDDLLAVMAALRTPGTGCPWDLEQTFATIAPYTIEEAYEVADAIERDDLEHLKEELGDLLLQAVYHSRLAEEQGAFAFADVVDAITAKMIRRHPHVFGTPEQRAAGVTPGFWERIKAEERAAKASSASPRTTPTAPHPGPLSASGERGGVDSVLDGVPLGLPALTRAVKLQNKAARVGFDWPSLAPVLAKVREELAELEAELGVRPSGSDTTASTPHAPMVSDAAGLTPSNRARIEEEFGDLLFVVANVARHLKLDPETALRGANAKFTRRFHAIEAKLAAEGRTPAQSTLEEMDRLWDDVKAEEK